MAEKKLKIEEAPETVQVRLPRAKGVNADQNAFVSLNFKNYIVERGKTVCVPKGVAEILSHTDEAEEEAYNYAEANGLRTPSDN